MSIHELVKGQQVTIGNGRAHWTVHSVDTYPSDTYGSLTYVYLSRVDNAGRNHLKMFTSREIARGAVRLVVR